MNLPTWGSNIIQIDICMAFNQRRAGLKGVNLSFGTIFLTKRMCPLVIYTIIILIWGRNVWQPIIILLWGLIVWMYRFRVVPSLAHGPVTRTGKPATYAVLVSDVRTIHVWWLQIKSPVERCWVVTVGIVTLTAQGSPYCIQTVYFQRQKTTE